MTAPHGPEKGYHARPPKELTNGKQQFIPGAACKTPAEAVLRLAKFVAAPFEIEKQDPDRARKGESKKARKRMLDDMAHADPGDLPAWVVSVNAFKQWELGLEPPASMQLSAGATAEVWRLRAWASAARMKSQQATPVLAPKKAYSACCSDYRWLARCHDRRWRKEWTGGAHDAGSKASASRASAGV